MHTAESRLLQGFRNPKMEPFKTAPVLLLMRIHTAAEEDFAGCGVVVSAQSFSKQELVRSTDTCASSSAQWYQTGATQNSFNLLIVFLLLVRNHPAADGYVVRYLMS